MHFFCVCEPWCKDTNHAVDNVLWSAPGGRSLTD